MEKGEGEKESEPVPAHRRFFSSAREPTLAQPKSWPGRRPIRGGLDLEQDGVDGKVTHTHQHSHATNTDLCRRRPHDAVGGGGKARRKLGLGLGARQRFRAVESSGWRE